MRQVLSLGAGQLDERHELSKAKKWGMTGWVRPLMNIMMDGTAGNYTHTQITNFLQKPETQSSIWK